MKINNNNNNSWWRQRETRDWGVSMCRESQGEREATRRRKKYLANSNHSIGKDGTNCHVLVRRGSPENWGFDTININILLGSNALESDTCIIRSTGTMVVCFTPCLEVFSQRRLRRKIAKTPMICIPPSTCLKRPKRTGYTRMILLYYSAGHISRVLHVLLLPLLLLLL